MHVVQQSSYKQLKIRSVPKSFELYHKYVYFQHTDNLISPEMVSPAVNAETTIQQAMLSPTQIQQATSEPSSPMNQGGLVWCN